MTEPSPWPGAADPDSLRDSSDALYRSVLEQMPAVSYVHTNERVPEMLYVSPRSIESFGRPPSDFVADPTAWERSIHPDDRDRVQQMWDEAFARQDRYEAEYRWIRSDGEVRWFHDGAVLVRDDEGRPLFWQGLTFDVTESKRTEETIRASEARYRLLVENIPAVVYQVAPDDDRRTLFVSRQVEVALGYGRAEWLEQPDIWMELLHREDREVTLAAHDRHNESGEPWSREYRLIASDGRPVWFRDVATLVRDERGNGLHWLGVQLDITELKRVEAELRMSRDELERRVQERTVELEEANEFMALEIAERRRAEAGLRETEHRYRVLAEQIPAVTYVWQVHRGGPLEPQYYTSPRIEQMLGYTVEEWHRHLEFWMSRLHPDDRTAVIAATLRSESTGQPFQMEYRLLHKDGHIVWVLDDAALLARDAKGRPALFQGVMIDVTKRHLAEAKATVHEQRFRSLAERVPAVIYVAELHGELAAPAVTYVSPQISTIL